MLARAIYRLQQLTYVSLVGVMLLQVALRNNPRPRTTGQMMKSPEASEFCPRQAGPNRLHVVNTYGYQIVNIYLQGCLLDCDTLLHNVK
jgi:hypothetical protein